MVEPPTVGPMAEERADEDVVYLRREVELQAALIGRLLERLDTAAADLADSRVEVDDLVARMLWAERRCAAIEARLTPLCVGPGGDRAGQAALRRRAAQRPRPAHALAQGRAPSRSARRWLSCPARARGRRRAGARPASWGSGWHRSGTSALANLLGDLGLRLPDDQMEPNDDNPEGFGESVAVEGFDDDGLAAAGGSWHCAPPPVARPALEAERLVAGLAAFRTAFGGPPSEPGWVLKDPRLTLLVPEWRQVLGGRGLNALVLFRAPCWRAARPLLWRAHTLLANPRLGLALWERSYRQLLKDLTSADRILFTDFDALLVDAAYRAAWAAHSATSSRGSPR